MRHVDEGTIHAWLDDQIADSAERAWVDAHLRSCAACGALAGEERATRDRADALLAAAAPPADRPPLDSMAARAGVRIAEPAGAEHARGRTGTWLQPAAWAASLTLAIGAGWVARELTARDTVPMMPAPLVTEQASSAAPPAPTVASPGSARAPSPAPAAAAAADVGERGVAEPETSSAPPRPPAPLDPSRHAADAVGAPPSPIATPAPALAEPTVAVTAPPPTISTRSPQTSVRIMGESPRTAPAVSQWLPVPRTEAAVRTGMPLYGIDGLEPVRTEIAWDGITVRTTYLLESGEVELVQQRAGTEPRGGVTDRQATARALSAAAPEAIAGRISSTVPRTWSDSRGNVRITLRTTSAVADLDALGARLRVD